MTLPVISSTILALSLLPSAASAQVSFYPIKPDPALDGATQMGVQYTGFLRLSGTALFGTVYDHSVPNFDQFGPARWGLDGVLVWDDIGSNYSTQIEYLGEDGFSRILFTFWDTDEISIAVFADGNTLFLDHSIGKEWRPVQCDLAGRNDDLRNGVELRPAAVGGVPISAWASIPRRAQQPFRLGRLVQARGVGLRWDDGDR